MTVQFRFNTISFGGIREIVEADLLADVSAKASKAANGSDFVNPSLVRTNIGADVAANVRYSPASGGTQTVQARLVGIDTSISSLSDAVKEIAGLTTSSLILELTWSDLAARSTGGLVDGDGAEIVGDAGTHTDPVVGGTVSNSGRFRYSTSPAGWERIGGAAGQDNREAAEAAAAAVVDRIEGDTRPDALLVVADGDKRSEVMFDGLAKMPAARFPGWIGSLADRVLFDLLSLPAVQWRGGHRVDDVYSLGDVVQTGVNTFWFCIADVSRSLASPSDDATHWEAIPLELAEETIFDDDFTANAGAADGRSAGGGLTWELTGPGYLAGVVASGYMTSDDNTYYTVSGLTGRVTEFGTVYRATATPFAHTMAISPAADFASNIFNGMWHTNYYGTYVAGKAIDSVYWNVGDTIADAAETPAYKFYWVTTRLPPINASLEIIERIRGNFLFGYVGGELAFVELADKIGDLTGAVQSIFVQNHTSGTGGNGDELGGERIERVWVKKAA